MGNPVSYNQCVCTWSFMANTHTLGITRQIDYRSCSGEFKCFSVLPCFGWSITERWSLLFCIAVVKETLENRGALTQIKARIRAEVFNALNDQTEPRPKLSNENVLINELIREYLEFNNYKYSASVLQAGNFVPALDQFHWQNCPQLLPAPPKHKNLQV